MNGRTLIIWIVFLMAFLLCKRLIPWFGNLPGDIEIRKENLYVALPIASCLLLSIVLSVLVSIFRRF